MLEHDGDAAPCRPELKVKVKLEQSDMLAGVDAAHPSDEAAPPNPPFSPHQGGRRWRPRYNMPVWVCSPEGLKVSRNRQTGSTYLRLTHAGDLGAGLI